MLRHCASSMSWMSQVTNIKMNSFGREQRRGELGVVGKGGVALVVAEPSRKSVEAAARAAA